MSATNKLQRIYLNKFAKYYDKSYYYLIGSILDCEVDDFERLKEFDFEIVKGKMLRVKWKEGEVVELKRTFDDLMKYIVYLSEFKLN